MTSPYLVPDVKMDEGLRLTAYRDPGGVWTIGYGHADRNVHEGMTWTLSAANAQLSMDINAVIRAFDASSVFMHWWKTLSDLRQDVLVNMGFNLGVAELATWKITLGHVQAGEYDQAAEAMLASHPWVDQVGRRAIRLAEQMRTGEHQS